MLLSRAGLGMGTPCCLLDPLGLHPTFVPFLPPAGQLTSSGLSHFSHPMGSPSQAARTPHVLTQEVVHAEHCAPDT